jgi:cellulose synthase/poly-beta-1,6-N-acetylglucosamine synthase-like glycosyltransferase
LFWFDLFRFGFAVVFTGLHGLLMAGLFREWRRDRRFATDADGPAGALPLVSVIVPFRDEAARLGPLLESLGRQDYPRGEYIFIDDGSTDGGPPLLRRFAEARGDTRIITLTENPGPNRKQYAVSRGIQAARGRLLLFIDADCEAPPGWICSMVRRMEDPRTGLIIGPVFKRPQGRGFFRFYQCIDHAVRYVYLAASTGLGAAGGGFGNNLLVRREALDAIGGYEGVPSSPTEDAALIAQVRSHSRYRVRSACSPDVFVFTRGEDSWAALINQTLRWNNGGLFSPDPATRFNFGFLMITISLGIIALPLLPLIPGLWPLSAAVLLSMSANTAAVLGLFGSALPGGPMAVFGYPFQVLFTPLYFTVLTILGFCGFKPRWKDSPVENA